MTNPETILQGLEPELRKAVQEVFDGLRDGVDMPRLRRALESGDIGEIEAALDIDEGSFAPYVIIATMIYMQFGRAFAPTLVAGLRFNPVAPPGINPTISERVTQMTEETRQMVREIASEGLGRRETARRIRASIGLSRAQAGYVESMRRRLASGDPSELKAVLVGNTQRDKRYDGRIKKAIKEGRPIPASQIEEMSEAYIRKLIRKRSEDIAAADALQYSEAAKREVARQSGKVVSKEWRHSHIYLRARRDHVTMSGRKVIGLDTPFVLPDGTAMQHPHDPAGGARHNANCRCKARYRVIKE